MSKFIRLSQEQRDNLVAYLDGELDEKTTQEIEQALASSPVARHEVDMLARSWDMLSALPTHRASGEFAETTVAMLRAVDEKGPKLPGDQVYRQIRRLMTLCIWIGFLTACGYVGYATTRHWIPNESEALLEDYDIINHLDMYRDSLTPTSPETPRKPTEFLEILNSKRTFSEHDEHGSP
ncbi:MAG: hypothetical protein JSS02_12225 [Planctomycetes bacterium]|nr:hypothetical protein [Planctomycetota bacterium]